MKKQESHSLSWYSAFFPVIHGFSTRLGGFSQGDLSSLNLISARGDDPSLVEQNYHAFHKAVGFAGQTMARNSQVHGDHIRLVTEGDTMDAFVDPNTIFPSGDGLLTQERNLALWVYSADCTPILFYDPVEQAVGAAHAGWRGTALALGAKMVARMEEEFGSQPKNIQVALGPSIGKCCFLCHEDVPQAMLQSLGEEISPYIHPIQEGKYQVDLQGIHLLTLQKAGIQSVDYESGCCTACDTHTFWSHRVMGEKRGSMGAMIALGDVP